MAPSVRRAYARVLAALEREGMLLASDAALPSVASIVAGQPVRGSWRGHPAGGTIDRVLDDLVERRDAVAVRLLSRKTTYVDRRLWPALLAVATAREPWQARGLSATSKRLLAWVEEEGEVRCDRLPPRLRLAGRAASDAARELEDRLLAVGDQVRTEGGADAKRLTTWARWARGRERALPRVDAAEGKAEFEDVVDGWEERFEGFVTLPWRPRPPGVRRLRLGLAGRS